MRISGARLIRETARRWNRGEFSVSVPARFICCYANHCNDKARTPSMEEGQVHICKLIGARKIRDKGMHKALGFRDFH